MNEATPLNVNNFKQEIEVCDNNYEDFASALTTVSSSI